MAGLLKQFKKIHQTAGNFMGAALNSTSASEAYGTVTETTSELPAAA
jgi:hypothetical protein